MDIENLVGGACLHRGQVDWAKSIVTRVLSLQPDDHVVVGLSHIGLLAVGCNWPGIRYVVRSGPNGADLALLDVLAENISARFDRVVIASGDGAFSDAISALATAGVGTTVLARHGTLARSLRAVASEVLYVPEPPPVVESPAPEEPADSRIDIWSSRDQVEWYQEVSPTRPRRRPQQRFSGRRHRPAAGRCRRRNSAVA